MNNTTKSKLILIHFGIMIACIGGIASSGSFNRDESVRFLILGIAMSVGILGILHIVIGFIRFGINKPSGVSWFFMANHILILSIIHYLMKR